VRVGVRHLPPGPYGPGSSSSREVILSAGPSYDKCLGGPPLPQLGPYDKCPLPLAGGRRGRYKVGAIGRRFVRSGFRALSAGPVARQRLSILRLAGVVCVGCL
jgi:hypothetical protein